jgi:NADPH:quinone reductase-like Zn-dependent oxidoreductase
MKAVGINKYLPISEEASLLGLEMPKPEVRGRDLLVAVQAIAMNPVDTKVRAPKSQVEDLRGSGRTPVDEHHGMGSHVRQNGRLGGRKGLR